MLSRADAGRLGYAKVADRLTSYNQIKHEKALGSVQGKGCLKCGRPIPFEKRRNSFCSRSCAASQNNVGLRRRRGKEAPPLPAICACGKDLDHSRRARKYCSQQCAARAKSNALRDRWLQGLEAGGSWCGVADYVRRWLVEQYGEKCARCGWAETNPRSGKIPVQVDHIDGDPMNHRPENLRFLCPSCHSLTPYFGILNKGRGRKQRYANVAQGQSPTSVR